MTEPALELFRNACGLSFPFALECEEAGRSTAPRAFEFPFALVGRDPKADLFLDSTSVSRRHVFLQAIGGRILVIDLQSRGKVYWEGDDSPRGRGWLDPHRYIQVGPYRIRLISSDGGADQPDYSAEPSWPSGAQILSESGALPRASLELPFRVGDNPSLWPVEGDVAMVGRADECQLVLTDESISRFHAALVRTPAGVWLVDLAAREGVYVNGQFVRWAWLADGDTVRLGRFTLVFRYETPPGQLTRERLPLDAGAALPEQPGTELVVRPARAESDRGVLAVRKAGRSSVASLRAGAPPAIEPQALVPLPAEAWEASAPIPASSMAMWQQQMQLMESFHNDMIMMVQMFVAMHREHMASVRHELDMVQKLTGELAVLQAKVAQSPGSERSDPTADFERPSGDRRSLKVADHTREAKASRSDLGEGAGVRPEPKSSEVRGGPRGAGSKARAPENAPRAESDEVPTADVHALLTQRIAQLQRERQGYWQRILSSINR